METYQVTQKLSWCCPGMLVFVIAGKIVGYQQNPNNTMTQSWADDDGQDDWGNFSPSDYVTCQKVA